MTETTDISPLTAAQRQLLFLTNNRSTPQSGPRRIFTRNTKELMRGKLFETRSSPPKFCNTNKVAFLHCENGVIKRIGIHKVGCNSWTCPRCQLHKALVLKYKLLDIARLNDIHYHLVLTLDPARLSVDLLNDKENHTHKYITKLYNHFITILKRDKFRYFNKAKNRYYVFEMKKQKDVLKYIWVLQYQPETGIAHLHVLLNQFLPIQILRKVWVHVGGGWDMRVDLVKHVRGISQYVTNYIVEGLNTKNRFPNSGFRYFERRYSISRSCIRPSKVAQRIFADLSTEELKEKLEAKQLGFINTELNDQGSANLDIEYIPGQKPVVKRQADDN